MKTLNVAAQWFASVLLLTLLSACGSGSNSTDLTVTANVTGEGGTITPASQTVSAGDTASVTVTPDNGFAIDTVSGCGGDLSYNADEDAYTTGPIEGDCTVTATFTRVSATVTPNAGTGGTITPNTPQMVTVNKTIEFTVTPDANFKIESVQGCGITQSSGNRYTTARVNDDCEVTATFKLSEPSTPTLSFAPVKLLHFEWTDNPVATHYRLMENPTGMSGFTQVGSNIPAGTGAQAYDHQVPLYARVNAQYILESCVSDNDCYPSETVVVSDELLNNSIGYFKADTHKGDYLGRFGWSVSLNKAGDTLAVGATHASRVYIFTRDLTTPTPTWSQQDYVEGKPVDLFGYSLSLNSTGDTLAVGARKDSSSNKPDSGAVYVFTRDSAGGWSEQANIKPINISDYDSFGHSVSLDDTGNILAVGAIGESSSATGIGGNEVDDCNVEPPSTPMNCSHGSGAVYVYIRDNDNWSQEAYIKASNTDGGDQFGWSVSLNKAGDTLAVGARQEDGTTPASQLVGDETNSGAVYVFTRIDCGSSTPWCQQAYIKAGNAGYQDEFGTSVSLNDTGNTLAVGADGESSNATGVNPSNGQKSFNYHGTGAVFVFTRNDTPTPTWSQQAYIKASNTDIGDNFGHSVSLDSSGDTLAVGATREGSAATGINGDQLNNDAGNAGAVYVYTRDDGNWSQQAYIKASNTDIGDAEGFGTSVSLDGTGDTLAVGAYGENSGTTGINESQEYDCGPGPNPGLPIDSAWVNCILDAGAVYLY